MPCFRGGHKVKIKGPTKQVQILSAILVLFSEHIHPANQLSKDCCAGLQPCIEDHLELGGSLSSQDYNSAA